MLLRVLALLLLGAAFARPVLRPRGAALVRVFVADRSRDARADVGDSVRALWREGDAIVVFDSAAHALSRPAVDSLIGESAGRARGRLSAGFVAGRRSASDVARSADSVELVVVSPFLPGETDGATSLLFSQWPGRVRLIRTRAAEPVPVTITLADSASGSPLAWVVAVLSAPNRANSLAVRVIRDTPSAADSAAASAGSAVVFWPRAAAGATMKVEGLSTINATLVASLGRLSVPTGRSGAGGLRTAARWADGSPAAIEQPLGGGCIRTVGVGLPASGDLVLQPSFAAVARELLSPCGGARSEGASAADSSWRALGRSGAAALAPALLADHGKSPLAAWLLGSALAALLAEWWFRSRPRQGSAP